MKGTGRLEIDDDFRISANLDACMHAYVPRLNLIHYRTRHYHLLSLPPLARGTPSHPVSAHLILQHREQQQSCSIRI